MSYDITIYPAENGYSVQIDRWGRDIPSIRYNAATLEDALAWIGRKVREIGTEPEAKQ